VPIDVMALSVVLCAERLSLAITIIPYRRAGMVPGWAQLLKQHRKEGHFGLTLSFLVGAMRNPPGTLLNEDSNIRELRSVLESMRDQSVGTVRILKCLWLQQAVAALEYQVAADEVAIQNSCNEAPGLFVAERYLLGGGPDVDTVCRNLWSTFQQPINEGRFSYQVDDVWNGE
jgi:hypothetical protein